MPKKRTNLEQRAELLQISLAVIGFDLTNFGSELILAIWEETDKKREKTELKHLDPIVKRLAAKYEIDLGTDDFVMKIMR